MPRYQVTSPDGKSWEVNAPDGATQDQVLAYAQSQWKQKADIAAKVQNDPISEGARNFAKDGSFLDNVNAGAGKAMTDLVRGIGQKFGLVSAADIAESRRLDAPLMRTGGGITGNIGANVTMLAPTALLPGAATIPGAAALGATVGLLQPATSEKEVLINTGFGAAGGAGGQWLAGKAANVVTAQAEKAAKDFGANAQKVTAAQNASKAGYVIPPADLPNAGKVVEAVSGLSGKIKTAQQASAQNQQVTNKLARQALGVADDTPLTLDTLKVIRSEAGQAYEAIKGTGTITADAQYKNALANIASKYSSAAKAFPGAVKNDVGDLVKALDQPSFSSEAAVDMTKVLRETADSAFSSGNTGLGKAAKQASDALEAALERHLKSQGAPEILNAFRDARQTIAKTYTVQRGLNSETGDVSAQALAALLKKDKPLSGELRTIAEAGMSFPKATQALKESPKQLSPLDFGAAGMGLVGSGGNPLAAAGLIARPAARAALLSAPVQSLALRRAGQAASPNPLLQLAADNPLLPTSGMLLPRPQIGQ